MTVRKTVTLVEEINSEYGAPASPPLRRVAIAAVFENPLAGKAAGADLKPLIECSLELGASLTKTALATLGASPTQLRAYTKAAVVGIGGDLEHGAAMIQPRLGMAMRRAIKRGRVIIPGRAKVGPPGTTVDLIYGPLDERWDLAELYEGLSACGRLAGYEMTRRFYEIGSFEGLAETNRLLCTSLS